MFKQQWLFGAALQGVVGIAPAGAVGLNNAFFDAEHRFAVGRKSAVKAIFANGGVFFLVG